MSVKRPTKKMLSTFADELGMELTDETMIAYQEVIDGSLEAYDLIELIEEQKQSQPFSRDNIHEPSQADNLFHAWYVKCTVKGAKSGKLKGKTFAIKDNTNVADVPMMNGSATLRHYIPTQDATIVKRILAAGGTILGKAHCECFCFSGSSFTNARGPVLNPHKKTHSSGGSSSGSAVLVANGDVDMATGGDQGGSIRIPASWCGICGMKPTFGLVPYTGMMPIEYTLDHAGPMTKNIADNALLLEVLAGYDEGQDTRQSPSVQQDRYTDALGKNIKGMKIGLLKEGFEIEGATSSVNECVKASVKKLEKLGAEISTVSTPLHLQAMALWSVIAIEGAYDRMMRDDAYGSNDKGLYDIPLMNMHHHWRTHINELSDTVKVFLLSGYYVKQLTHGVSYAKARYQVNLLKKAYDKLFEQVDVLLMPTTPMQAHRLPKKDTPLVTQLKSTLEMIGNTCPFNLTGHPALSLPCGVRNDLPVGMMLVGRDFSEKVLYQIAYAYEQSNH